MAFEKSLQEVIKNNSKIIAELEKRMNLAGLNVAQSAAKLSSSMIATILNDKKISETMDKITSFAGTKGKQAAKKFADEYKKGALSATSSLNKLSSMINDVDRRTKLLADRQTAGWSKAAMAQKLVMSATRDINDQIKLNNRLMLTMNNQLKKSGLSSEQKRELKQQIDRIEKLNQELKATRDNAQKLGSQMRALEIEEFMQKKKEGVFGGLMKARDKAVFAKDAASHLLSNPKLLAGAIATAFVGALMLIAGEAIVAGKVFRDSGQTAKEMAKSVQATTKVGRDMLSRGVLGDTKEWAEAVDAAQKSLGRLDVPREMLSETAYLANRFKLSNDTAAQFLTTIYRFSGQNAKLAVDTAKFVANFANKNNLSPQAIFKSMAEHANDLAKSGNMSAIAFARAAADAQRIGFSMSSISGLADRLVGDFEGALRSQAELATMFPGMDLTETIFASQFGTEEDIQNSVKDMIQSAGFDFNTMPRSFKLALAKNTGLSASELANITGAKDMTQFLTPEKKDEMGMMENVLVSTFDLTEGGIGTIIKILRNILLTINPIFLTKWAGSKLLGLDQNIKSPNAFQAMSMTGVLRHHGGMVDYSGMQRMIDASVYTHAPRFHTGLRPNEIPAILEKGEAVLTNKMMTGLADIVGGVMEVGDVVSSQVTKHTTTDEPVVDTTRIENLLVELIKVMKSGMVIELDGKKVGKGILESYSRS